MPEYSVNHYENFPVASLLLPKRLRRPVRILYRFARDADDIADEGDFPAAERLARLDAMRGELQRIEAGEQAETAFFRDLATVIGDYRLPLRYFHDLLDAFSQDVHKTRYADFGEVIDYCRRSANPVGRLMLHLFEEADPRKLALSDGICTALQLINFLQDVAVDYQKGRIYLPQVDLARFRISEEQIAASDAGGAWPMLMAQQVERARKMLQAGAPLGVQLPGRFGLEIRLIILGGDTILRRIHLAHGDVFAHRPALRASDWPGMLYRAVRKV